MVIPACRHKCAVPACPDQTSSRHRFPRDPNLLKQWLDNIKQPRLQHLGPKEIRRSYYICQRHFAQEYVVPGTRRGLRADAVPTLNVPAGEVLDAHGGGAKQLKATDAETSPVDRDLQTGQMQDMNRDINIGWVAGSGNRRKLTAYHTEVVEDPTNHQLVEDELLHNLSLFDVKFLDFPNVEYKDASRTNFRRDENYLPSTANKDAGYNSISLVPDEYVDLENCTELFQPSVSPVEDQDSNVVEGLLDEKPYFKSVKSFLQDDNRMAEVCRICLHSLKDEEVIRLYEESSQHDPKQLKKLLELVLPNLDLEIYPNIVICVNCVQLLIYSYQLREKWLSTEEKLQKIIAKKKGVIDRNADLVIIGKRVEKKIPLETDHTYVGNPPCEKPPQLDFTKTILEKLLSSESQEKCLSGNVTIFHGNLSNEPSVSFKSCGRKRPKKVKEADSGPHVCETCGNMFPNKRAFRKHSARHRKPPTISNQEPTHLCETCGKLFKTISGLRKHTHEKKKEVLEHKCKFCDSIFQDRNQLRRHITSKHSQNLHQCHLCGKRFNDRSVLAFHLKRHDPENKTQACQLCDRKFFYACNLKKHQSSHVKERLLKCDHCGKFLKHKWSLEKHIQIKHLKQGTLVCEFCNKMYWKRCDLTKHLLQVHCFAEGLKEENPTVK